MKRRELVNLGIPSGPAMAAALDACRAAAAEGFKTAELRQVFQRILTAPRDFAEHPLFGDFARCYEVAASRNRASGLTPGGAYPLRNDLEYAVWGTDIEAGALSQMRYACQLPVSVAAALMPDAHVGYGLPIGGVLATENAVIPYAVGVDIACRVKVSVFDLPPDRLFTEPERFEQILERETRFGVGARWPESQRPDHDVLDADWNVTALTRQLKDKAWSQLGTSGSGNHFVEFGELIVPAETATERSAAPESQAAPESPADRESPADSAAPPDSEPVGSAARPGRPGRLGLAPGRYLAVVSHSGSRGLGAQICGHYSKLARALHPNLPRELSYLAWLPMDAAGAEYWAAMELAGAYASANHDIIHRKIARALRAELLAQIENHHNFAWREEHGGRSLIVHRKGATPAGRGVIGYIPGTMAAPGFIVEGLGDPRSLNSASHGAGRRMSRTQAKETVRWNHLKAHLEERGVRLISAGLDEAPHAYKDIEAVMTAQAGLVRKLARFDPRIVKMAPDGEPAED